MGVLLDNQKAIEALIERCRSLESRVAANEDRLRQLETPWWLRLMTRMGWR